MKFLVDAQLPVRLARFLKTSSYDTIHTRDLPREMLRQIMRLIPYQFNKIEF